MPLFSQRKGIQPLQKAIQREDADEELRNRLWNVLQISIWESFTEPVAWRGTTRDTHDILHLCQKIWHNYFKLPLDTLPRFDPGYSQSSYAAFRNHFLKGEWWEVYDFLEFILKNCPDDWATTLRIMANDVLETENAAYRFVGDEIVDISDDHEIAAIEEALATPFGAARTHLERSLELISDRQAPDYRNAVKEAISAVESAAQEVSSQPNATLGDCIKFIERNGDLHPAFKDGLLKLYGYTSDSGGIRHALTDRGTPPTYAEAKFMLVACSAFVNLLVGKKAESDPGSSLKQAGLKE